MTTEKYVFFWNGIYSQWYPSNFRIAGKLYTCAEQWMMAEKARTFNDTEALENIIATSDPGKMKFWGRQVKNYDEDTWSAIRYQVVVKGNIAKFSQNDRLKKELLDTGDRIIVEASPHDKIWGIGLGEWNKECLDESKWLGQNLLGKAIMEARDFLRNS